MQVDKPYAKPYVLRGHDREVTAVAWCPTDPHSIATCGDDATIKLWSVQRPWPPAPPAYHPPQQQVSSCSLVHVSFVSSWGPPWGHMWTAWGVFGSSGVSLGSHVDSGDVLGVFLGVSLGSNVDYLEVWSPGHLLGSPWGHVWTTWHVIGAWLGVRGGGSLGCPYRSCLKQLTNGMAICSAAVARLAHMVVTYHFDGNDHPS